MEVGGFVACFNAISLERRRLSKTPHKFSSRCCARAVGIADEPAWSLYSKNKWRQTNRHTHRHTNQVQ